MRLLSRRVMIGIAVVVLAVVVVLSFSKRRRTGEIPSALVESGTFVISLSETGELRATRSTTVSAPRVGNWNARPQVVRLAPEGETVEKGDFLAQFDPSALDQTIQQKQSELEIANADLARARSANLALIQDLTSSLANVKASYEMAKLQLEQMQFEAEVKRREQELQLERSLNDVKRAETKLESQRVINTEEERKLELRVNQAKAELQKAILDKDSLTLTAPMGGLVVYPKVWSGGSTPKKVQEGDTPWPGQPIIELPDLSEMEVATEVSEVDVSKVEPGQKVEIRLDAFPESLFTGSVTSVATLAKEQGEENPAKVFEVTVLVENNSPILRPGMTASARIIVNELPDRLWIPVDAVFSAHDTTVVYRVEGGTLLKAPVALGPKNENAVVVKDGLAVGDRVSLVEPGVQIETLTSEPTERTGKTKSRNEVRSTGRPHRG